MRLAPLWFVVVVACQDRPAPVPVVSHATPLTVATPVTAAIALGVSPLAIDEQGIPRILRASKAIAAPAATATESARALVAQLAPAWGLHGALPALVAAGEVDVPGGRVVRLQQVIEGIPVEDGELRILVRPGGELVAASGIPAGLDMTRAKPRYRDDDAGAVALAVAHNYHTPFDRTALHVNGRFIAGTGNSIAVQLASAHKVWHRDGRTLIAAWVVEVTASRGATTGRDAFRTVIAAADGRVLAHRSLVDDAAFNYRVFAEPTGEMHPHDGPIADFTPHPTGVPDGSYPPYIAPSLVTVDGLNHPAGQPGPDPWLAAAASDTHGNNVDAYTDLTAPDGFSPPTDFRAVTTAAGAFDRVYALDQEPAATRAQQMAAVTSLFFMINWLHDFWYDAGFVESAGNAQAANFGRGGVEGDAIHAEAQDASLDGARNNANMSTPSDGLPPTMQVYLWSGDDNRSLTIAPSGDTPKTGGASFGPKNFTVTGTLIAGQDGVDVSTDACTALTSPMTGLIVLVDRNDCSYKTKVLNVQTAGGIGVLIANNAATPSPPSVGEDQTITAPITIPTFSITQDAGAMLRTQLGAGPVTVAMSRAVGVETDGSLDASVIAHEFGHYLHHRLSACNTTICRAVSEGWGDFSALMLIVREGDNLAGAFPFAQYVTQSFNADPGYFGIRRAPYSTSFAINALSFRHMADGEPMPTTHPFDPGGPNSEVHNAGEVWAAMLWEGYAALQQAGGASFDAIRAKMAKYVVAGLLMMPPEATQTEARDAILVATAASSPADADILAAAFARRGFGSCAVSPPRESTDFVGIVESTVLSGYAEVGTTSLAESTACDGDGILDANETARVTVPLANHGYLALANVHVTLTSATPGITITPPAFDVAMLEPGASMELAFDVAYAGPLETPTVGELALGVTSTGGCADATRALTVRLNVDDVPKSSTTDRFDTAIDVWTPSGSALWTHVHTALDGSWLGADRSSPADVSLESPPMVVDSMQPLVIKLTHRYAFEFDGTAWDGGVIEYSTDAGGTWVDIATLVNPGYGQVITTESGNVLGGRAAFTNTNPSNPGTDPLVLDLGTQLAGQTIQLRFRIGTDAAVGAAGWEIEDVAITGIVGTPFPSQVGDPGICGVGPGPDAGTDAVPPSDGGCCGASHLPPQNAGFAVAVLAILLRRRPKQLK